MELKLECHFKTKGKVRDFDKNTLTKFYVDIDKKSKYPSIGEFQFWGDKVDLSELNEGDAIIVYFNIQGKKIDANDRSFFAQNLNAWKIEKMAGGQSNSQSSNNSGTSDDLPF